MPTAKIFFIIRLFNADIRYQNNAMAQMRWATGNALSLAQEILPSDMSPSKIWESPALIRFSDCDPFNHLNNARYIDYFINAREDQLRAHMQFNIYEFAAKTGFAWVVGKNQVAYLRPAALMETVVIDSTLLRLGEKDISVEMRMWNENKNELKAVLWSQFVHIHMKTGKPAAHAQELMERFRPFENPLAVNMNFDERVEALRSIGKKE